MDRCEKNLPDIRDLDRGKLANGSDSNNRQHVNSLGCIENSGAPNSVQHSSLLPGVRGFDGRLRRSTDLHSTNGLRNTQKRSIFLHRQDHDNRLALVDLRRSFFLGHICYFSRETSCYKTTLEI